MATIHTVYDQSRGCGDRKGGGLYMMGGEFGAPCGRMPFELTVCPCCSQGVKPARSWTWLDTIPWVDRCQVTCNSQSCGECPLGKAAGRCGLIWIGEKFYATPADFLAEANRTKLNGDPFGISRRLTHGIPKGFEVGKTWVLLAHRKAIAPKLAMAGAIIDNDEAGSAVEVEPKYTPGVFAAFRPTRIEYVITGKETEEELDAMEKRGITIVCVVRLGEQLSMQEKEESDGE